MQEKNHPVPFSKKCAASHTFSSYTHFPPLNFFLLPLCLGWLRGARALARLKRHEGERGFMLIDSNLEGEEERWDEGVSCLYFYLHGMVGQALGGFRQEIEIRGSKEKG